MKIKKINISSFGKLSDLEINPGPGLNIIYAPNESGKTTLLSFLKYIFYGVKQKKPSGDLSFKERYTPWNGLGMSGSCEIDTGDRSYVIQRSDGEQGSKLSVFDLASGEAKKEISNPGLFFMNIGERSFADSCFVSNIQSICNSSSDGELISFLTDSYDDKATYSAIRKELNEKLLQITSDKRKTSEISLLSSQISQKNDRMSLLKNEIEKLKKEISEADILKKKKADIIDENKKLEHRLNMLECDELIEERDMLESEKEKLKLALSELQSCGSAAECELTDEETTLLSDDFSEYKSNISDAKFSVFKAGIYLSLISLCFVISLLGGLYFKPLFFLFPVFGVFSILSFTKFIKYKKLCGRLISQYNKNLEKQRNLMEKYGLKNHGQSAAFVMTLKTKENNAIASRQQKTYRINQIRQIENSIERLNTKIETILLSVPESVDLCDDNIKIFTKRDINAIINDNDKKIDSLSQDIARCFYLETELGKCESELSYIQNDLEQYNIKKNEVMSKASEIETAIMILDKAFDRAKTSFFPELSTRTEEIYSFITGTDECRINSNDKFELYITDSGYVRDARFLSKGTLDLLYFSLRIAIIDIMGKNSIKLPLFLDDVFSNCDDKRTSRLMEIILKLSQNHQIFLCTCRGREGEYFKANKDVNIITLQKG
ncbi:MAG: AAA family ATPase [Clostridia bacterium]|nr:AAA family ATPase [Clostridia bacterium]